MGKYLQDIQFRNDHEVIKKGLLQEARLLSDDMNPVEDLFNKHLPKKIEIGQNIWRFIIWLTPIEEKDGKLEVSGLCQDYYAYVDFRNILQLSKEDREKLLIKIYKNGIIECCEANNYTNTIFLELFEKIDSTNKRG